MALHNQIQALADAGSKAGDYLWLALEAAHAANLHNARMVEAFDAALEQITELMPEAEGELFGAYAEAAIPISMISRERREAIANKQHDAWAAYYDHLVAVAKDAAADLKLRIRMEGAAA